jgi:hypothetical protein
MPLKFETANGAIIVTGEDGSGDAAVTFPRGGIVQPTHTGNVSITGDLTTVGTFDHTGNSIVSGGATMGSASITGGATMGSATVSGNASITGSTTMGSAIVSGNASITGSATMGSATVSGEFIADSVNETYSALSGTTVSIDCETGNFFALSTTGNTTFTFSNSPASGIAYSFTLKLTAGGTHTITYPASVDWAGGTAPDAPASGETDLLTFTTYDGGAIWYGFQAGDAMA